MGGENKRRYTSRDGYAEQDRKVPHITHLRPLSLSFQDYCCKQGKSPREIAAKVGVLEDAARRAIRDHEELEKMTRETKETP
jgi:hypothetical protein